MLSPCDAQLIRREPDIPGLKLLLDPDALAAEIRRAWPEIDVRDAGVQYLRYKPGTNCLAACRLQTDVGSIDVTARAGHRLSPEKFSPPTADCRSVNPLETRLLHLERHTTILSVFPHDRRLPSLQQFHDPVGREPLLRRLFPAQPDLWSGSIRYLKYKPERRCVAQLLVEGQPAAILRLYTEHGYRNAWQSSKGLASRGLLQIADRLGRLSRENILAFEWLPGRSPQELLSRGHEGRTATERIGAALAELHIQAPKHLQIITRDSEAADLRATAESLASICPQLRAAAVATAGRLADALTAARPVYRAIHGDFYADQVLLNADHVGVVDLDEAAWGDPAADLGNFSAHLHDQALRGVISTSRAEELCEALTEGYQVTSGKAALERVDLYTAACLLRLAPHPFRTREPDWAERTEAILAQADSLFGSRSFGSPGPVAPPAAQLRWDDDCEVDSGNAHRDCDMPLLLPATDPAEFCRLFGQHLPRFFRHDSTCLSGIRVIRHKPGRRCLIEYRFRHRDGDDDPVDETLIGKMRADRINLSEYQLNESLWRSGFDGTSRDGVSVPEPVGVIPELHMWLQRKMDGTAAFERLLQNDGLLVSSRIADAIHRVHAASLPVARRHSVEDELQILHDRLGHVIEKRPHWEKRIRRILNECTDLAARMPPVDHCGIHRDFYPDQVLIDSDRICVLDFELYCEGDPALDIGNFIGHLIEYAVRQLDNPDALSEQQQVFRNRYLDLAGDHCGPSVDLYTTLTLARHIYLSTHFKDRKKTTRTLIDLCEDRLRQHAECRL